MAEHRKKGFFDTGLETSSPGERAERQARALREQVDFAYRSSPAMKRVMDRAGVKPDDVRTLDDLAKIPVTPKSSLAEIQGSGPMLGGLMAAAAGELNRMYLSPGGILDPEGRERDYWRLAALFYTAGARPGDVYLVTLGYHLTPGGLMCDGALRDLGAAVAPTGVGNTDTQVEMMKTLAATGYLGTPSFLAAILDRAVENGLDVQKDLSLAHALVAGEMLPESLRARLENDFGLMVRQFYATADVGAIAAECPEARGMHLSEHRVVEIADPETGEPVAPGEVGQVVVTMLANRVYPILRFGTGDLSYIDDSTCPCGRTSPRLVRLVGRVDQVTKVRGMFIYPAQVSEIAAAFHEIEKVVAVVDRVGDRDVLTLKIVAEAGEGLTETVAEKAKEVLKLRADVEIVEEIEEQEKVIVDVREWD